VARRGNLPIDLIAGEPSESFHPADVRELEARLRRSSYFLLAAGVLAALAISGWRMALGVMLGGALNVFNLRWLRASTGAILRVASGSGQIAVPRGTVSKFLLRYVVIGVVVVAAAWSRSFDLLGVAMGLATFVGAAMIEAAYQIYLTISKGEQ